MTGIKELITKYRALIAYLFFGVCTTLINWISYYCCYNILGVANVVSTVIAWILAVAFAFVTNKKWVFQSNATNGRTLAVEISTFVLSRVTTGVLDVLIMWIAVDVNDLNATVWKLLSNALVIILNYILSKLVVFKKRNP